MRQYVLAPLCLINAALTGQLGSLSEKFEPVDEQVSGNGDFAKRCRNCVVNGRAS
jgi:hypothetical protein